MTMTTPTWHPLSTLHPTIDLWITVRTHGLMWTFRRRAGRWQRATEFAWEDATLPTVGEWAPVGHV